MCWYLCQFPSCSLPYAKQLHTCLERIVCGCLCHDRHHIPSLCHYYSYLTLLLIAKPGIPGSQCSTWDSQSPQTVLFACHWKQSPAFVSPACCLVCCPGCLPAWCAVWPQHGAHDGAVLRGVVSVISCVVMFWNKWLTTKIISRVVGMGVMSKGRPDFHHRV